MTGVNAIEIRGLEFAYTPGKPCFRDFSLDIPAGQIFGLFGPNGAGKSTLMFLMTGVLKPDAGEILVMGQDFLKHPLRTRSLFGFVPQDLALYEELSPLENLEFFGALCGLSRSVIHRRADDLLAILGLSEVRRKPVRQFSGGMKRRVNLAIGVIHHPPLIFLDEPTVGVDVQTRMAIVEYLRALQAGGTTLVYTSHQLAEAEDLCESLALIDQGRLLMQAPMSQLRTDHPEKGLERLFLEMTGRAYRN